MGRVSSFCEHLAGFYLAFSGPLAACLMVMLHSSGAGDWCLPRWQGDCLGNLADVNYQPSDLAIDGTGCTKENGVFPVFADWDSDGDEDLIIAYPGGIRYFERLNASHVTERIGPDNPFNGIDVSMDPSTRYYYYATVAVAIADWDDDDDMDLVVGGAEMSQFRYYERVDGASLVRAYPPFQLHKQVPRPYYYSPAIPVLVDWDGDGDLDFLVGSIRHLFYFERLTSDAFELRWGDEDPFSRFVIPAIPPNNFHLSPSVVDFDLDGDMDLVLVSVEYFTAAYGRATAQYFERVGSAILAERRGASHNPFHNIIGVSAMHLAFTDWGNDGQQDFVFGEECATKFYTGSRKTLEWQVDDASYPFKDVEASEFVLPAFVDWNGDGLLDVVLLLPEDVFEGRRIASLSYYERTSSNPDAFAKITDPDYFRGLDLTESLMAPSFADWNQDGLMDMVAYEGGTSAHLKLYERLPNGTLDQPRKLGLLNLVEVLSIDNLQYYYWLKGYDYLNEYYYMNAAPCFVDWDRDGDYDLVVTILKLNPNWWDTSCPTLRVRYWENDNGDLLQRTYGDNPFNDIEIHLCDVFGWEETFAVTSFWDLDQDGDTDMVISTMDGTVYFERGPDDKVTETELPSPHSFPDPSTNDDYGDWSATVLVDWDNDADPDIVVILADGSWSFWSNGACTQPTPCTGNGLCKGFCGKCECLQGYSGSSCAACSPSHFTNFKGGDTWECTTCPGISADAVACNSRGTCQDDADARALADTATLAMLARGHGECRCSEEAFTGGACEEGTCSPGTYEALGLADTPNFCAACPAGRYSNGTLTQGTCFPCPPGLVSAEASGECYQCPDGQHPGEAQTTCKTCDLGQMPVIGTNACTDCPAGKISSVGICEVCGEGQVAADSRGACTPCEAGEYPDAGACVKCPELTFSEAGASICKACSAGQAPSYSQAYCEPCPPGQAALEGLACERCQVGQFTQERGAGACEVCALGFYSRDEGARSCQFDLRLFIVALVLLSASAGAWYPLLYAVRRSIRLVDMRQVDDGVIFLAMRNHTVAVGRSIRVMIRGSGVRHFDDNNAWLTLKALDARRLKYECSKNVRAEASSGWMTVQFAQELYKTKGALAHKVSPLVNLLMMGTLIVPLYSTSVVLVADSTRRASARWLLSAAPFFGILLAALAAFFIRSHEWAMATPMSSRIHMYRGLLAQTNPEPCPVPRGPRRAVTAGHLRTLFETFADLIQDRDAYYLDKAITKPVTRPLRLSMSEVMGPGEIKFFVSHYWGTCFKHFVEAVKCHAQQAGESNWATETYWICFLSNNQWDVKSELGDGDWRSSSFYLALQSNECRATCMIVDTDALPLTRAWCLFEVLQTYKLSHTREDFGGLLFCTSQGTIGVHGCFDITLALAQRLSQLSVRSARASNKADEVMIQNLVAEEEETSGSTMDAFISQNMSTTLKQAEALFAEKADSLSSCLRENAGVQEAAPEPLASSLSSCLREKADVQEPPVLPPEEAAAEPLASQTPRQYFSLCI